MTVVDRPLLDETFAQPVSADRLDRAAAGLRGRGYTVHIVQNPDEARRLVLDLLPPEQGVLTATSETLRISGLAAAIDESPGIRSVRRQLAESGDDFPTQVKIGAAPDVVVGSVHAITEDGTMVAASASGSQLASYAAGALTAIWVVGAQKIVSDLDAALRRVRTYSLPREWDRAYEVYGQPSFIGKILILEREAFPNRGTVVLVREAIGF
jgi:hypothetical protein